MSEATNRIPAPATQDFALDEIDYGIIQALQADIKTPNKRIAQALGVAESTIAARIRSMSDRGVMRVLAETDMAAFGYHFITFLGLQVQGRKVDEVAAEIVAVEEVASLVATVGRYDLVAMLLAADAAHYDQLINGPIGAIKGITRIEPTLATETFMQALDYGSLGDA